MALIVVTGSPGCGKSTWMRHTAKPGDIHIGSDELTNALTGQQESKHHHTTTAKKISNTAREAAIQEAIKHRHQVDVWVLISNLTDSQAAQWRRYGARFIVIDPGYDTALQRCKAYRPGYKHRLVDSWYAKRDQWPRDAEIINPGELDSPGQCSTPPAKDRVKRGSVAVHVVTGPPAAGKSTHVRDRRQPGDVTIDFDTIANELSGLEPANHEHTQHIKQITKKARQAAIDTAISMDGDHTVWVIHSSPSPALLQYYKQIGAVIDEVDPGKDVVMRRIKTERPASMLKVAAAWYANKTPQMPQAQATTTERGYGWSHQQKRESLLRAHLDGSPCWWCGLPMFKDKTKNWDNKALARDHVAAGGARDRIEDDRLLHLTCNSQRQDGRRDHLRPVVSGRNPSLSVVSESGSRSGFSFGGVSFVH